MEPQIVLKNIKKTFYSDTSETKVIDDLSFSIYPNEVISLLGPSGCGKSTVLNIISGLEKQTHGQLLQNTSLGYMFQKDNLLPWRTVYKNIIIGLEIKKRKNKESEHYAKSLLKKYGLYDFIDYYPDELSGGMRQRVSLIRTLVLRPEVLLLDEPFSALDSQTRLFVQEDVKRILLNEKKSALMVTHDISEGIAMSSRILLLTPRPLTIKQEINLEFDASLTPSQRRTSPLFQTYFASIYKELHYENT